MEQIVSEEETSPQIDTPHNHQLVPILHQTISNVGSEPIDMEESEHSEKLTESTIDFVTSKLIDKHLSGLSILTGIKLARKQYISLKSGSLSFVKCSGLMCPMFNWKTVKAQV